MNHDSWSWSILAHLGIGKLIVSWDTFGTPAERNVIMIQTFELIQMFESLSGEKKKETHKWGMTRITLTWSGCSQGIFENVLNQQLLFGEQM